MTTELIGDRAAIATPILTADIVPVSRNGVILGKTTVGDIRDAIVLSAGLVLSWAYSQSFRLVSATRDGNGAITTASIVWPDGATGTFTTDAASAAFPGAIDAWHATYVIGAVTKTYTQPAVTRDANGAVTAQPAITVA